MSEGRDTRDAYDDSYLTDDLDESLINSPAKKVSIRTAPSHNRHTFTQQNGRISASTSDEQREAGLRQELANVRKVNEAIEGVIESLEKAKSNMKNVDQTVGNASSLLNIWTRTLSQTEHNQRLMLDPSWQGASQDIADMEEEAQAKQQAAERREAEEQERRAAAAARRVEEEERRQADASTILKPKPSVRGRGGSTRGSSTGRAGYVTMGGSASTGSTGASRGTTSSRRATGGIGRGTSSRYGGGRG